MTGSLARVLVTNWKALSERVKTQVEQRTGSDKVITKFLDDRFVGLETDLIERLTRGTARTGRRLRERRDGQSTRLGRH